MVGVGKKIVIHRLSVNGRIIVLTENKKCFMKESRSTNNKQSKQGHTHKPKPDIRDMVDSRKNEEYEWKGTDVTHNKKEQHSKNEKGMKNGK